MRAYDIDSNASSDRGATPGRLTSTSVVWRMLLVVDIRVLLQRALVYCSLAYDKRLSTIILSAWSVTETTYCCQLVPGAEYPHTS